MKKFYAKYFIFLNFGFWRMFLFLIAALAPFIIKNFNPSFPYFNEELVPTGLPEWIWGFGNFDGVHYLRIAENGYQAQYSQAFFPFFPLLIHLFNFGKLAFLSGFIISNICFLIALFVLYKLFELDYQKNIVKKSLVLLLVFPTAYYFGSVYTESLFLLLSASAILFIRKENFLAAGLLGFLASLTKLLGMALIPVFLFEAYLIIKREKLTTFRKINIFLGIILSFLGTLTYMIFLKLNFNNPIYFLTSQPVFGAQRSQIPLITLPQVLYRYFKILTTVAPSSYSFFNAFLELVFTVGVIFILIYGIRKIRTSYLLFTLGCLLPPTLTGTLSSMPRYILMAYLFLPIIVSLSKGKYYYLVLLFLICQVVLLTLFLRGYWIA